jgi:pimeloyl-ACP methyl ester carboxylesterase
VVKAGTKATNSAEVDDILARGDGASIAYRRRVGSATLPGVVFLGGFRSDMTGSKASALDEFCHERGQSFVRFDYQAHGASSGRFEDGTIGQWLDDSLAVIDQLSEGPQILVGSSMGGWLALLAALRRPSRIVGIVTIAAAADFTESIMWPKLGAAGQAMVMRDGQIIAPPTATTSAYPITKRFIEEARSHLLLGGPIALDIPILLFHGLADRDVPWRQSLALIEALTSTDARLTLIKDGDHRLSTPEALALVMDAVAALSIEKTE